MKLVKKMTIKRISITSVFKLFTVMFMIFGLTMGAFSLFGIGMIPKAWVKEVPFLGHIGFESSGVMASVIFGVLYGFCAGVTFALLAFMYNLFVSIPGVGGIKIVIEE